MKVQPSSSWLLLAAAVSIFGSYATTTAAETQQRQAEVAIGAGVGQQMLKFGAKTPVKTTQETILSSYSPRQPPQATSRSRNNKPPPTTANTVTPSASAPRMSRRYDSPEAPPAQLITQYNIPIVNKNRDAGVASQKGRQRSRQRVAATSTAESLQGTHSNLQGNLPEPRRTSRDRSTANVNSNFHSNVNRQVSSSSRSANRVSTSSNRSKTRKTATTTTTTTTTTTSTTTPRPPTSFSNFPLSNPFNLFPQSFWNLSNPPPSPRQQLQPTSTKKPPKKYIPTPSPVAMPAASLKEEKLIFLKPKLTIKPTKEVIALLPLPLTTPKKNTQDGRDGPFRIALPTINFFGNQKEDPEKEKEKRATIASLRERFNCPRESEVRFQLFPKICKIDKDCSVWNRDELCCEIFGAKSCVSGIPKPLEETSHAPILGLIPRKCPTRPLAELWWEVKECETDMDCWPRVCCPDGRRRYCRTSQPELETVPVPVKRSFNYLTEYLECTAPPPPIFDLHPKACTSTFDCFPNVCCQEAGLRHCRPPKKSVLTLMANFLNVDFVKRLTQNIVIK